MAVSSPNPRVVVAIVNWRHYENTLRCLEALSHLDYAPFKAVVVDNASHNDSLAAIRAAYPHIRLLEASENLGYAAGNALALQVALEQDADLFWILNPDAIPPPDALSRLVDAYRNCGDGLYGGIPVEAKDGGWWVSIRVWNVYSNGTPDLRRSLRLEGNHASLFPDPAPQRIGTLYGSSLMIPLNVVRQHGFIDTSFFLYGEETDYALRLAARGVPSYLVPSSVVVHPSGGAHKHEPALMPVILYYQTRNRLTVSRRHRGTFIFLRSVIRHMGYVLAWFGVSLIKGRVARHNALYTLRGIRDALRRKMGKTIAPEHFIQTGQP